MSLPGVTMRKTTHLILLVLCVGGCVLPYPSKVTSGHKYSTKEIAFLDLPGTTREEVLSTLGEPLLEVPGSGVLLYVWEVTPRHEVVLPDEVGGVPVDNQHVIVNRTPREWGLFIAYDELGYVTAHEVRRVGTSALSQACIDWRQSLSKGRP